MATAAMATVGGVPQFAAPAKAQALQPVVDVCTGISLEPSAVTDIVGSVAVPTAGALEDLFDALLSVSILGNPILTLEDVDIGAEETLQAYADGDPIALRVADTSGTLLAADSPCNLTADGYTLNDAAGLAIGGNQITGLGNGQVATAGELDAIAFGNNASTAVGANGAIAVGTNASATVANSIALGNESLADRGALTDYTAPFLADTYSSVGTLSVGAPGSLRQITNVAPGTAATDVATVGQVQGAIDALQVDLGNGVQYDGAAQTSVTLAGAGGTTIANLADGDVSASSTEAVNGSQLFATNQNVAANTDDIAALDDSAVQYDDASGTLVTLDGAGGTTIANVADGTLSDTSGDAVNGSQLFATNQQVAVNTAGIGDLDDRVRINAEAIFDLDDTVTTIDTRVTQNRTDIDALQASVGNVPIGYVNNTDPTVFSSVPTNRVALIGATPGTAVTLSNVAAGELSAGSNDAINGSQLFATNQQVDVNTAAIQANTDAIAAIGDGGSGNPLAVLYDDASRSSLTLDGTGGTTVGNLANGEVSATSNEAVNGSQLFATNQAVAANTDAIDNLDGRVTVNEQNIANLDNRVTTIEGDITDLDARVAVNEGDIADLDNRVAINEGDISNLDDRVTINEGDIANLDTRVAVNEGDIDNLNTSVTNIDARVTENSTQISLFQNQLANVPIGYVSDTDPTVASDTPTNTVALIGSGSAPVTLTNVSAGRVAVGSTDAVNGGQLAATNAEVSRNRTDIDQNTADIAAINNNLAGSTTVAVQYSDPDNPNVSNGGTVTNDVALVGADASAPVALHNLAAGTSSTDAVNLGQLQSGLASAMADSRAYTDLRFGDLQADIAQLDFDLGELRQDAAAGTASAMAVSGIPQTINAGRSMLGGGIAHYRGETAFALGMSTTFNDGKGVVKAGATVDTRGNGGFSAGAGFSF
tara:strand:- start:2605 stop:5415 length:2811 start_codon:yes stop_codon:yes gene_type:complete